MVSYIGRIRYALGSAFIFGAAPEYFALWALWRGVSLVLPNWIYQWGDDKLYSLYQTMLLFFFETCTGVEVIFYGDAESALKKKESVLYLANHQSTADWLVANMVAIRGNSIGHMRYVMKDALQLIPLYGYYFFAHGCIYVKRSKFSEGKMLRSLQYLNCSKIPSWMIIFPEGTRYYPSTPKVIQKSEQFASDHNMKVLRHHLVPKARGAWLILREAWERFEAVYDISVVYENTVDSKGVRGDAPQIARFLMGGCPRVHIHLRRISMSFVPKTEEEFKNWMHELFVQKDRIVAPFLSENECVPSSVVESLGGKTIPISLWSTLRAFLFFSVVSVPFVCTSLGRKIYCGVFVYGSLASYGWLAVRSVC